jgi:mono/diheme cytochrome c family protein
MSSRLSLVRLLALGAALGAIAIHAPAARALDEASATGAQLFGVKCAMCHRAGGMGTGLLSRRPNAGTGLLEERRDLTLPFVIAVTRNGSGNMPRIARGEVSDVQLARIAAYLAREPAR